MSGLISRADTIERIANDNVVGGMKRINEYRDSTEHNDYLDGISTAIATVDDLPSADAVQGEWQDKEVFTETDDDHFVEEWQSARCSVCGKYHTTPYMYYFDDFNYCPNCGARMTPYKGGAE